jgi:hypothetical protein
MYRVEMGMGICLRSSVAAACMSAGLLALAGCGGSGNGGMNLPLPISVSLSSTTVTVMPKGMAVRVLINIVSTSETAQVSVAGLPGGVGYSYAASDTNPSGLLTFTANSSATPGTNMPAVTVMSAGQTASTKFTLVVQK